MEDINEFITSEAINKAKKKMEHIYQIDETEFTKDAQKKKKQLVEQLLASLPRNIERTFVLPDDSSKLKDHPDHPTQKEDNSPLPCILKKDEFLPISASQKAILYYIKGKALDVFSEYSKEAEIFLSKCVKLNPSFVDAWNSLGRCCFKRKDLTTARSCYEQAISLSKNKVSLRELSRVIRLTPQQTNASPTLEKPKDLVGSSSSKNPIPVLEAIDQSVEKAKEAVSLDIRDGESWHILGNAYLNRYITLLRLEDLDYTLKAFKQAEQSPSSANNPDLHFNRATIYRFVEEYEQAASEYKKSYQIDPTFEEANTQANEIIDLLEEICSNIETQCGMKNKHIRKLLSKLEKYIPKSGQYKEKLLSQLIPGQCNMKSLTSLCILQPVGKLNSSPSSFICIDEEGTYCVLSIYNVNKSSFKRGDCVTVVNPLLKNRSFSIIKNNDDDDDDVKKFKFQCISVIHPTTLFVNKKPIPNSFLSLPVLKTSFM